jgi:PAS domain S-box-containing protein
MKKANFDIRSIKINDLYVVSLMAISWPYPLLSISSVAVSWIISALLLFTLCHRAGRGSSAAVLLVGVGFSLFGYGAGSGCSPSSACSIWMQIQFVGSCFLTAGLALQVTAFAGWERWLTRRNTALIAAVPVVCAVLGLTNDLHRAVWSEIQPALRFGPGFWVLYAGQFLAIGLGLAVTARAAARTAGSKRWQAVLLLGGLGISLAGQVLFLSSFAPGPGYSPGSSPGYSLGEFLRLVGFTITAVLFFIEFSRNSLPGMDAVSRAQVVENMPDIVVVLDMRDRIVDLNPPALQYLGIAREKALGHSLQQLIPQELEQLRRYQHIWNTHEYVEFGAAEARQYFTVSLTPLYDRRHRLCGRMAILRDTSALQKSELALKEANQRLEVLNQRLVDEMQSRELVQQQALEQQRLLAAVDERERLARDLHDNLGQVLGFFNMQAHASRQHLHNLDLESVDDQLKFISEMALESQVQLRDTIRELKSPAQVERRFLPNLERLLAKYEHDFGIRVTQQIDPQVIQRGFDGTVTPQLLNIIQEGLNNTAKHSGAAQVTLKIAPGQEDNLAEICISDDGSGFDPLAPLNEKTHFGLRIMQERAALAGGTFDLQSQLGQGTRIVVRVPLRIPMQGENL